MPLSGIERRIGYREAEALSAVLAGEIRSRLGSGLSGWGFRAIPRGGLIVLGMLSYLLELRRNQVEPRAGPGEVSPRRLVVVDDCALSGARFGSFLAGVDAEEVAFVHLLSHPELRRSVVRAEPRVRVCLAAEDLGERPGAPSWDRGEFWDPWRERLPGRRYWLGAVQPVAFAWSAPEVVFWEGEGGELDDRWRRGSPASSLDGWARAGLPARRRPPAFDVPDTVLWKIEKCELHLRSRDRLYRLSGSGLEMWRALLAFGPTDRAVAHLAERYEAGESRLATDLGAFAERLVEEGLLKTRGRDHPLTPT